MRPGLPVPEPEPGETVVAFDDFVGWIRSGKLARMFRAFDRARILVHRVESSGRPLPLGLALRWLTRGNLSIEDSRHRTRAIDASTLADWLAQIIREPFRITSLLRKVEESIARLEQPAPGSRAPLDLRKPPLYLRSDLSFGVRAGGSVGHIAGVVNELARVASRPVVVTTDEVATIDAGIEQHLVSPPESFWNFRELPTFVLNEAIEQQAVVALRGRAPSFVYQRYSVNNYAGVRLARMFVVPLVIEYNGSEIWMSRHWGRPLKHEALSERIERLNLTAADLVVVVSRPMKDEIVGRGVDASRVLVNPNGVDPDRYSPAVDGGAVREKYGLTGATVIGFIGTFGRWHGAETLARAYVKLCASAAGRAAQIRLLMIGTGVTMPDVERILSAGAALGSTVFTGLVPQEEGAQHLAACDILVSPHVPNPDGTPFFGSPTKLFEYMAMGKGIVASKLDQIGEVLEDGKSALLVPPGDVDALAAAIARLAGDRRLRECLGAEARRVVLERYTWFEHTRRIVDRLTEIAQA